MNKIVSLTVFWFCFICVEGLVAFGMIHAKSASLTSEHISCAILSPPQTPLLGGRGQNVFEERNFQNFLPGLHDNGVRGADVVIVVVEDCSSSGRVVFHGGRNWLMFFSPVEWPGKAELTRARWLRSSRLDPQSALHCYRSCLTSPATRTGHSCSYSQCWTDPGSKNPHNCFHS